jgi:hypothetical protein
MRDFSERREGDGFDIETAQQELAEALTPLLERSYTYDLPDGTRIGMFKEEKAGAVTKVITIDEVPEWSEGPGQQPVITQRHTSVQLDSMPGYMSISDVEERVEVLQVDQKGRFRGEPVRTFEEEMSREKDPLEEMFEEATAPSYDAEFHQKFMDKIAQVELSEQPRTPEEFTAEVSDMLDILGTEVTSPGEGVHYLERSANFTLNDTKVLLRQKYDESGEVISSDIETQRNMPSREGRPWELRELYSTSGASSEIAAQYWSVGLMPDIETGETIEYASRALVIDGAYADVHISNVRNMLQYLQSTLEG